MRSNVWFLAILPLIGGCALPVPVQVAMWALDGVSLASSQKTLTEHGISALAQRDCSLWRGVVDGGEACREDNESSVVAAALSDPAQAAPGEATAADAVAGPDEAGYFDGITGSATMSVAELAEFETAAGLGGGQSFNLPGNSPISADSAGKSAATTIADVERSFSLSDPRSAAGTVYCVIGSFGRQSSADAFARRYREFSAEVIAAPVDGRLLYRVAVGPLEPESGKDMRARLVGAGIADVWLSPNPAGGYIRQGRSSDDAVLSGS